MGIQLGIGKLSILVRDGYCVRGALYLLLEQFMNTPLPRISGLRGVPCPELQTLGLGEQRELRDPLLGGGDDAL